MENELYYRDIEYDNNLLFVDLRTPEEFLSEHIPGAVNWPIFTREEHIAVSTCYKEVSREDAKLLGVEYASRKLPELLLTLRSWRHEYDKVILYCARGGYRSSVLFSLVSSLGMGMYKLQGGYKAYRRHVIEHLASLVSEKKFIVLYGNTGTGKTKIIHALQEMGANGIDLEGLARHRGSLLGGIGLDAQPSQKQFESALHDAIMTLDEGPIFIEGESKKIGNLHIPDSLYKKMQESEKVHIIAPMEYRVRLLKEEYTEFPIEEISAWVEKLTPMIGKKKTALLLEEATHGEFDLLIRQLLENYYDQKYNYKNRDYVFTCTHENENEAANILFSTFIHS